MQNDEDDFHQANTYKPYACEWRIPYIENESPEERMKRSDVIKQNIVNKLAGHLVDCNAVDISVNFSDDDIGKDYVYTATCLITNPMASIGDDIKLFHRMMDYANNYPFDNDNDRRVFVEVLETLRPKPVMMH